MSSPALLLNHDRRRRRQNKRRGRYGMGGRYGEPAQLKVVEHPDSTPVNPKGDVVFEYMEIVTGRQMSVPFTQEWLEREGLFLMTQQEAAKHIGVGTTTLKKKCRFIGLTNWPYRRG